MIAPDAEDMAAGIVGPDSIDAFFLEERSIS